MNVHGKATKEKKGLSFFILISLLVLLLTLITMPCAHAEEGDMEGGKARIAILPFENMTEIFLPIDEVMGPVYKHLQAGFLLSTPEEVDEAMLRLRLRHTGYLTTEEAVEIGQILRVDAVILGMICAYQESPNLRIGLIVQMIGTGGGAPLLWMKSMVGAGDQREALFGLNRISEVDSLVEFTLKDMTQGMPLDLISGRQGDT